MGTVLAKLTLGLGPESPSPPFLLGVDLFNHGYYWEAHEVWEGLWRTIDRSDPRSAFLQGLIHLAAAGVKVREGQPAGVRSHGRLAFHHFRRAHASFRPDPSCARTDGRSDRRQGRRVAVKEAVVAVVFPFPLLPHSSAW